MHWCLPQTAEQKSDLTADWELDTRKSCGLHREQEQEGGSSRKSVSGREAVKQARLALGLEPFRIWSPQSHTAVLSEWRRKWVFCREPPFSYSQRTPEGEQSPRPGPNHPAQRPVGQLCPVHLL